MTEAGIPPRKAVEQIVAPLAKEAGFKKSAFSFTRRRGTAAQVLNFQFSSFGTRDDTAFYINVGLNFDEVCTASGEAPVERLQEYRCQVRARAESCLCHLPDKWPVRSGQDPDELSSRLAPAIIELVAGLDGITSLQEFLAHPWARRIPAYSRKFLDATAP